MTDNTIQTPIPAAGAKPWWKSQTMWAGVTQVAGGIAMVLLALVSADQGDLLIPGLGAISTGLATLQGRVGATQPILPALPGLLGK